MGIVHSAFITTTCSKLLLWFVLLLMLRLRRGRSSSSLWSLRLCWLCCPIHIRLCWISICRPRSCRRIRRCRKIRRQLCRSCPCCQERLRLMPMLMLTTDTTDMPDLMLTVLDTEATDTDTHMLTTERDLLMLSQRPRLMPLSSTEPMDMLVSHTLDTLPMVLTHMPTELTHMLMELTTERDPLMPSQRPMPTTDTTDMPDLTPTDMPHMLMELTHTVMDMPGESKLFQPKVLSYCKPKAQ